jgi:SpoVK/Ycf46/Vps4 family AAA+-type ATPase
MNPIIRTLIEKSKAGYPALYMTTPEDQRAIGLIEEAAASIDRTVYVWTLQKGVGTATMKKGERVMSYVADTGNPDQALEHIAKLNQGAVVVLRHYHHFMESPAIQAMLLDLIPKFKATRRQLIILTPVLKLPPELEKDFSLIELPLPTKEELLGIVDGFQSNVEKPDEEMRRSLADGARGFTISEAENAVALAAIRPNIGKDPKKDKLIWDDSVVRDEKCDTVKKSGFLTYYPETGVDISQLGGMDLLKGWLQKRAKVFKNPEKAAAFGLPIPKGVLMLGPPGTGKSLGARVTATTFKLPLIRVDMGAIFGGIVGQSEANARAVIRFLEAVAPCVGWLDEIEKGFAGSSGGQLDSGVGARVLGTFLTWMQEKTAPVFIYATANNVHALPPELLRKGRFDEMFFVDLPTKSERKEIFRIHVKKFGREKMIGKQVDIDQLAQQTDGYTGSEIEAIIRDALFDAFEADKDLNMFDIQEAKSNVIPLSKLMKQDIDALRAWANGRTRPASFPEEIHGTGGKTREVTA